MSSRRKLNKSLQKLANERSQFTTSICRYSEGQVRFAPLPNEWNMLQVLQHLVFSDELAAKGLTYQLERGKKVPTSLLASIKMFGLKIAFFLPLKFRVPRRILEATPEITDKTLESLLREWETISAKISKFCNTLDDEYLSVNLLKHPRIGYINLSQTIDFTTAHIAHHLKQINQIANHASFPSK